MYMYVCDICVTVLVYKCFYFTHLCYEGYWHKRSNVHYLRSFTADELMMALVDDFSWDQ